MRILLTIALLLQCLTQINGFGLSSILGSKDNKNKKSPTSQTSELFQRMRYYETTTIKHNQFHLIDDANTPVYPTNGKFQFEAFGKTYNVWFRKNQELFSDNFKTVSDTGFGQTDRQHHPRTFCNYFGEVTNDPGSLVSFTACKGRGLRGTIQAFNETLVIEPLKLHTDEKYGRKHRLDDEHIVYKYDDVDRSTLPGDCGHGYDRNGHTHSHDHSHSHSHSHSDSDSNEMEHDHDHSHHHHSHDHDHDHEHTHEHNNDNSVTVATTPSMGKKRSIREKLTKGMKYDKKLQRRRMTDSTTTQYVELLIVNDPGRVEKFMDSYDDDWYDELVDSTIDIVNTVATRYLGGDWGEDVGTIQIVLSQILMWHNWTGTLAPYKPDIQLNEDGEAEYQGTSQDMCNTNNNPDAEPSLFKSSNLGDNDYCEVDFDDYLDKWHDWRKSSLAPAHDNAQLFSYYDFYGSVIGYASLPGMCITASSGGINQCTYSDTYNANIVSHEMGHNFDMAHDGTGNTCDDSYIMASTASPYGYTPTSFSTCSVAYVQGFFEEYANTVTCLENEPYETEYAVCGNGFVEQGESCDCGSNDCSSSDSCCDGSTCTIYSEYECSNDDLCCEDCLIKSAGSVCRAKSGLNYCDIDEEKCDGQSSECPADTFNIEGTECFYVPDSSGASVSYGLCYNGDCISIEEQCDDYQKQFDSSKEYDICTDDEEQDYTSDTCGDLYCSADGAACDNPSTSVNFENGTPCRSSPTVSPTDPARQCVSNSCQLSSNILTYTWTAGAYGDCSKPCKDETDDEPGSQVRTVNCTLQDGTFVDDSNCDEEDKPQGSRDCNDFVCTFCEGYLDENGPCGDNGICVESSGSCDCDNGYSGTFCDTVPGLNWIGFTRRVFNNGSLTLSYRADPCSNISQPFDGVALTVPLEGVSSLTEWYIGETIYMRWNSSGDLDELAVGIISWNVDNELRWPEYVGTDLADDNQDCDTPSFDDGNGTFTANDNYDPCFEDTTCDDFGFEILPEDMGPGVYQIVVKFNNDFVIYSENVTIKCNEAYCNSAGHGSCSSEFGNCTCDEGWYGSDCSENNCIDWEFSNAGDAFTAATFIARCNEGEECNDDATTLDDLCTCGEHWTGTYCEVPIDGCSGKDEDACNTEAAITGYCEWDGGENTCVYAECASYDISECGVGGSNSSTVCEVSGFECVRTVCPDLPDCENGAVRRQLNDELSICYSWYCDCSTVENPDDTYWTVTTVASLTNKNVTRDTDLFTCAACDLDCKHGSDETSDCTECEDCDEDVYGGVDCDKIQWVADFKIGITWDDAAGYDTVEFNELMVDDLRYYFGVSESKIEIWQLKEDTSDGFTIVYFKYIFDTTDEKVAQSIGGDLFTATQSDIATEGSDAYRGFIMGTADSSYELEWCIPTKEECDPDAEFNFRFWFFVCLGGSYGFELLLVLLYRLGTARRRQKKYEEKVREVRKAQLRLMEHHQKARRVGMRDVGRSRAKKVHQEKVKVRKAEVAEARRRSKVEADEVRRRGSSQQRDGSPGAGGSDGAGGHNHVRSEIEFQQHGGRLSADRQSRGMSGSHHRDNIPSQSSQQHDVVRQSQGGEGGGGAFNAGDFERPLPPGWVMYVSNDGIPYYYNAATGVTSWRHPLDPQF